MDASPRDGTVEQITDPPSLRRTARLAWQDTGRETPLQTADATDAWADRDGRLAVGMVALLADSTGGSVCAVEGGYPEGATVALQVLLAKPLPQVPTRIAASVDVIQADLSGGLVQIHIRDDRPGRLAVATLRQVNTGATTRGESAAVHAPAEDVTQLEGDVDDTLGITDISVGDESTTMMVEPSPALANAMGSLHGGIVASLIGRATRAAALASAGAQIAVDDLSLDGPSSVQPCWAGSRFGSRPGSSLLPGGTRGPKPACYSPTAEYPPGARLGPH